MGLEQHRHQVEQPFHLGYGHPRCYEVGSPAAGTAEASGERRRRRRRRRRTSGSSSRPAAHRGDRRGRSAEEGGRRRAHRPRVTRWRRPRRRRHRCQPGRHGHLTGERTASRTVHVWWLTPRWRVAGVAVGHARRRRSAGRRATRRRRGWAPPRARWCRAACRCRPRPGPWPRSMTSAPSDVAGQRERGRHASPPRGRRRTHARR